MSKVRTRFWFEASAAFVSLVCCVVTALTPAWLEAVFGIDPDGGSGAIEWLIVVVASGTTLATLLAACLELRAATLDPR